MSQEVKDLIAEARRQVAHIENKSMRERLISDLADALEATLGEPTDAQVEAAAKVLRGEKAGVIVSNDRLRAALKAAGVVPVQGETSDDRTPEFEAIEQELFKHQPVLSMQDGSIRGCHCMDRVFMTKTEDWGTHLTEAFMRLSRATVSDAATAVIERVRSLHYLDPYIGKFGAKRCVCEELWPCSTIAALDGGDSSE